MVHYDIAKAFDGEESPLLKYVDELKQYKEDHPERYLQIHQTNQGWEIAQATNGTGYFMVRAPRSGILAIKIDAEGKAKEISHFELLEDIWVDKNAKRVPLPDNWQQLSAEAIKTYNQYFIRINKSRAGDKATAAKEMLVKINNTSGLLPHSKNLLKNARKLVDRGSFDIIKKVLAIGRELEEHDSRLFSIEQQDIDEILEREIGKLVANVESKQGEASIVLATIK